MKAVFLDRGSFPSHIDIRMPEGIELINYHNTSEADVAERIVDADIVLTNKVPLKKEAIERATKLKLVQVMATGTNNVDSEFCQQANIAVQNVEGYSTVSVPEHTFSLMLALRRNLFQYIDDVKKGKWSRSEFFCFMDYPIKDLAGSRIAIYGSGALGTQVSVIAKAFGMEPCFVERKNAPHVRDGYIAFEEAITTADIHTFHCPLTPENKNTISDSEFDAMKTSALLINTGRGGLIDEEALIRALEKNKIAGAALDVATIEPMPKTHPLNTLKDFPNFLLTPHIAWASDGAMQKLVSIAVSRISNFIETSQ
ncbi:D-2-hydroxyacid dehydrogenase [Marinomonas mediterranea]|uniref:D-2-hydroxyacid dehydrogenase n=1 Tax=Marinomonas mediterranea TaxID=119864 RepID=UPI00234A2E00|nr:D-2-hydroxyacid dehydrogenase [Marinomonas mediterranea]WCN09355.1 glycerate dehydrogenase [Marinomonas mediterranea]